MQIDCGWFADVLGVRGSWIVALIWGASQSVAAQPEAAPVVSPAPSAAEASVTATSQHGTTPPGDESAPMVELRGTDGLVFLFRDRGRPRPVCMTACTLSLALGRHEILVRPPMTEDLLSSQVSVSASTRRIYASVIPEDDTGSLVAYGVGLLLGGLTLSSGAVMFVAGGTDERGLGIVLLSSGGVIALVGVLLGIALDEEPQLQAFASEF